jgi:hypothetical protein
MGLLQFAALGAAGYLGYRYWQKNKDKAGHAAFAGGQPHDSNFAKVRDAGPNAMRDKPAGKWSKVDEAIDQSFPASDPPANY